MNAVTRALPDEKAAEHRRRPRNARGEGARLAEDIVDGAMAIVERTDSVDAVTLRSVAREVGITAPSIYAHFPDREAILWAVSTRVFEHMTVAIRAAIDAVTPSDVVTRLVVGCEAYVAWGLAHPEWYRALFARKFPSATDLTPTSGDGRLPPIGGEALSTLIDSIEACVAQGVSTSADPFFDAVATWVALHGIVSLWSTVCDFPWPTTEPFVRQLVLPLAHVDPTVAR